MMAVLPAIGRFWFFCVFPIGGLVVLVRTADRCLARTAREKHGARFLGCSERRLSGAANAALLVCIND